MLGMNRNALLQQTGDDYTKLLLHMNGTNGSTTFTDSSPRNHAVTAFNSAKISTASNKFGGASGLFAASAADYLTVAANADWLLGTGDFTIECWVYLNSTPAAATIVSFTGNSSGDFALENGVPMIYSSLESFRPGGSAIATGAWHHVAWVRSGSTVTIYVDGVSRGSDSSYAHSLGANDTMYIGRFHSGGEYFDGYIDELRICKGTAMWTGNFTPQESQY